MNEQCSGDSVLTSRGEISEYQLTVLLAARLLVLAVHRIYSDNLQILGGNQMKKYRCIPCGYIYDPALGDPDNGIAPGTAFEDLPDDWQCPICFVGKEDFEPIDN